MADIPPKVKIYERPQRKVPSPLLMVIALLMILTVGYFLYKVIRPAPTQPRTTPAGFISHALAFQQETYTR